LQQHQKAMLSACLILDEEWQQAAIIDSEVSG
jgi:hypothetical protein